jgi:hypothetical protein
LRDFRVGLMIAGIVGKMKFERAVRINANIGQAERHGASRAALVQSDFSLRLPVDQVWLW